MANTKSFLYLFALFLACHSTELGPFGLPSEITKPTEGQIQIFNVIYPAATNQTTSQNPHCHCSTNEDWYLLRNPGSGLTVDADSDGRVTIQRVTEQDSQLWKFEPAGRPGVHYIINKRSGKVLEATHGQTVLTKDRSDIPEQQWLIESHGRLYNVGMGKNLDVRNADFSAGTVLQVCENNWMSAQVFSMHKEQDRPERVVEESGESPEVESVSEDFRSYYLRQRSMGYDRFDY